MGCYGLGISRIIAAIVENNNDINGIKWPKQLSPYDIIIVPIYNLDFDLVNKYVNDLYTDLISFNFSVLIENRDKRIGVVFKEIDLIGIFHRIVIKGNYCKKNIYEYKSRSSIEIFYLSKENLIKLLIFDC